jgi:transcriptional regulator with PAS, ATPase and Fis domain
LLAEHFLEHYSQKHGFRVTGLTEEAILKLQRYNFPGNVRELEHIIERAVLQGGGRVITPDLVLTEGSARTSELEKLLDLPFRESVLAWERLLIDRALEAANGNKAEAARRLGIHRRLLYEKLGSEES